MKLKPTRIEPRLLAAFNPRRATTLNNPQVTVYLRVFLSIDARVDGQSREIEQV